MLVFDHGRRDLQEAMARSVDGAMIWGGEEAVLQVRSLPFPHWARLADLRAKNLRRGYGREIPGQTPGAGGPGASASLGMFGSLTSKRVPPRKFCSWKRRLAIRPTSSWSRSGKHSNRRTGSIPENEHPTCIDDGNMPGSRLLVAGQCREQRRLSRGPDWTILLGERIRNPRAHAGKTLTVLEVDDLRDPMEKLDGNVQTLGLAMANPAREGSLASLAARRGVDRIVKLGRMHVFAPPWDGVDLIRPMVRMVRHVRSTG